jgi:acyl-CoA reductase-like NAD-dependent aldehyde dehydrogenase
MKTELFTRDELYIAGEWVPAGDRPRLPIIDPYTEQQIGSVPEATIADAEAAIEAAAQAFRSGPWRQVSYAERADLLARVADILEERVDDIVETYVHDLGGVRAYGVGVAARTNSILRSHRDYVGALETIETTVPVDGMEVVIAREPVGPLLAIVPWNAPLVLAVVKIAPALLAGCPVIVKVSPETPTVTWILAEAFHEAGLPAGMISFLPAGRDSLGNIAARPEFGHVSFTGSTASGTRIMEAAAQNIVDVTLELGGKSAAIILPDLNPAAAAPLIIRGSLGQSGQVCTTYSRILVPESRAEEWTTAIAQIFASSRIGDPDDTTTTFGPLVSESHRSTVERYIAAARADGATIVTGGGRPSGEPTGFFVEPTLISDTQPDMSVVQEEIFGPVTVVQTYRDIDDAIRIANATPFGLGAGVFTEDVDAGLEVARRLEAGNVSVNGSGACLTLPFGGYKKSGLGREGGLQGVTDLLETKQIQIIRKAAK